MRDYTYSHTRVCAYASVHCVCGGDAFIDTITGSCVIIIFHLENG